MVNWADLNKARLERDSTLYLVLSGDKEFKRTSSLMMEVNGVTKAVSGAEVFNALVHRLIDKRLSEGYKIEVHCGGNAGTDDIATTWAKKNEYKCQTYIPNWDKVGASALYKSSEDMFLWAGIKPHKGCLLLWDGENKITKFMMFCSWQYDIPCRVWNYIKKTWLSQDEILDIQMSVRDEQLRYGRC